MNEDATRDALERAYRADARRVRATLIRVLGGFDEAEEALHEAFAAAAEKWPREGVPENPYAWLVSTGRFRLIDRWRKKQRVDRVLPELAARTEPVPAPELPEQIQDDELALIFTCCHPALPPDARIALTLREVAGLTTEEIARAYLAPPPTIAQRIVRAKAKIREDALPYEVPHRSELAARLESALSVVYLIFNEGYAATGGPSLTRPDLCAEALRLGRLLLELLDDPEALGLVALMLLHEARRTARVDEAGNLVLLEDQDRSLYDRDRLAEARSLIQRALAARRAGPFLLQAAIADLHAEAASSASTDWPQIVALYDVKSSIAGPAQQTFWLYRPRSAKLMPQPIAGWKGSDCARAFRLSGLHDHPKPTAPKPNFTPFRPARIWLPPPRDSGLDRHAHAARLGAVSDAR